MVHQLKVERVINNHRVFSSSREDDLFISGVPFKNLLTTFGIDRSELQPYMPDASTLGNVECIISVITGDGIHKLPIITLWIKPALKLPCHCWNL